jgi:hypothetical protein
MLPPDLRHLERYSLPAVEQRLSEALELPCTPDMQDWAIQVGNAAALPRVLALLRRGDLSLDERFSLMALAIACADDALSDTASFPVVDEVWRLLSTEPALHASTIHYWATPVLEGEDAECWFAVSPLMASVWRSSGLDDGPAAGR